jgi:hypothetical protein
MNRSVIEIQIFAVGGAWLTPRLMACLFRADMTDLPTWLHWRSLKVCEFRNIGHRAYWMI